MPSLDSLMRAGSTALSPAAGVASLARRAVSSGVALVGWVAIGGCAVSEELSDEVVAAAEQAYGPVAAATSAASPGATAPATTSMGQVTPPAMSATAGNPAPSSPTPAASSGGGFGGFGGMGGMGATTSSASPAPSSGGVPSGVVPAASSAPAVPAAMTWETCDPSKAEAVCPEDACEASTLCSAGQGVFEQDCVSWCQGLIECVTLNSDCISMSDPLCYDNYSPRDACIDYIDSTNPKSKGAVTGNSNYAGSWGSKAALALLTCACGN